MPQPLEASMPQFLDLADGYLLRVDAVDPTTGVHVAGVTVGNVSIYGMNLALLPADQYAFGDWLLVSGPGT